MKNIFALNVAEKRYDGEEFIARRLDDDLQRRHEKLTEEINIHQKNASLPVWLTIAMFILGGFGFICVVEFLTAPLGEDAVSYAQAYANAAWVIWVGPICLAAAIVLYVIARVKKKNVEGSASFAYTAEQAEKFVAESRAYLSIPQEAPQCDVLFPVYKVKKNGKRKSAIPMAQFMNGSWQIFREGDDLCFGDSDAVFKIPADRIGRLVRMEKRVMFTGWNKPVPFNKGEYKQYKIRKNNYGIMFVKPYLCLQITGSEGCEILFPPYEHETLQRVTGKIAE